MEIHKGKYSSCFRGKFFGFTYIVFPCEKKQGYAWKPLDTSSTHTYMDWVCKYMEKLEPPCKRKSSFIQRMMNQIEHANKQLVQEEIQTLLGQMIETIIFFGSDGLPMWS